MLSADKVKGRIIVGAMSICQTVKEMILAVMKYLIS